MTLINITAFHLTKRRIGILLSLFCVIPIGFYSKLYSGPAANWVNNSLVGIWYVIFWCLLISLIFDNEKPSTIVLIVLIATSFIEFLQLWHPPFLEWLRGFFIGRTILGTGFTWADFPYYFVGAGIGWFWLNQLKKISNHVDITSG